MAQKIYDGIIKTKCGAPVKNSIHSGMGGCDLGPRLVYEALKPVSYTHLDVYKRQSSPLATQTTSQPLRSRRLFANRALMRLSSASKTRVPICDCAQFARSSLAAISLRISLMRSLRAVSYTHLDVYKRQVSESVIN